MPKDFARARSSRLRPGSPSLSVTFSPNRGDVAPFGLRFCNMEYTTLSWVVLQGVTMIQSNFHGAFRSNITSNFPNSLLTPENPFLPTCTETQVLSRSRIKVIFSRSSWGNPRSIYRWCREPEEIPSEDEKVFPAETRDDDNFCGDTFTAQQTSNARGNETERV